MAKIQSRTRVKATLSLIYLGGQQLTYDVELVDVPQSDEIATSIIAAMEWPGTSEQGVLQLKAFNDDPNALVLQTDIIISLYRIRAYSIVIELIEISQL